MIKQNKKVRFFALLGLLTFTIMVFAPQVAEVQEQTTGTDLIDHSVPKLSGFWSEPYIHITGANWSLTNSTKPWCSGTGTWADPYVIENVTIDALNIHDGILIENSNVYFIIRNCTVMKAPIAQAGVYLNNVKNGTLEENNISNNFGYGVLLQNSDNNSLTQNYIENNNEYGIWLVTSDNNSINLNEINDNIWDGIRLWTSHNNTIFKNKANSNDDSGYYIEVSLNNTLYENQGEINGEYGIVIDSSNYSLVTGNILDNILGTISEINSMNNRIIFNKLNGTYTPLLIDDLGGGDFTWLEASFYSWCNGTGVFSNPYEISNLIINAESTGSPIKIINSNKFFTLQNNTVRGAGVGQNGGIAILNSKNGKIIENNCSNNGINPGIYILDSENITVSENNATNNYAGIFLWNSNESLIELNTLDFNSDTGIYLFQNNFNNTISGNFAKNNTIQGIRIQDSNLNNITGNNLINNTKYGIFLDTANNNTITNNLFIDNVEKGALIRDSWNNTFIDNLFLNNILYGVHIDNINCENNQFIQNNFTSNGINAYDEGQNNDWNTTTIGNYWGNYTEIGATAIDDDDDGIGNTAYIIYGTSISYDYLPIWDDGHDGTLIHIDNTGVNANNWTWMRERLWTWVLGTGTSLDPYIIRDISINANNTGSGIIIENSNVFFTLKNCTILNATIGSNAGIKLLNVENGIIANCNLTMNKVYGIYLNKSNNILIINSSITQNNLGIYLNNSNDNNITLSTINSNILSGIYLLNSHNNSIQDNSATIANNGQYGIYFSQSNENDILRNAISNNPFGIYLYYSDYNNIIGNVLTGNTKGIEEVGCTGNYFANNEDDSIPTNGDGEPPEFPLMLIIIIVGAVAGVAVLAVILKKKKKPAEKEYIEKEPPKKEKEKLTRESVPFPSPKKIGISEDDKLIKTQYFRDLIDRDPNGPVNQKNLINISNLEDYEAPPELKKYLKQLYERSEAFIPSELPSKIMEECGLSEVDAEYYTFTAFNTNVFLPVSQIRESRKTESEVKVEKDQFICIVHKGPVSGENVYLCPKCNSIYCKKCARTLKEKGEDCWSCGKEIQINGITPQAPPLKEDLIPKVVEKPPEIQHQIKELEDYLLKMEDYIMTLDDSFKTNKISQEEYLKLKNEAAEQMGQAQGRLEQLKS